MFFFFLCSSKNVLPNYDIFPQSVAESTMHAGFLTPVYHRDVYECSLFKCIYLASCVTLCPTASTLIYFIVRRFKSRVCHVNRVTVQSRTGPLCARHWDSSSIHTPSFRPNLISRNRK